MPVGVTTWYFLVPGGGIELKGRLSRVESDIR